MIIRGGSDRKMKESERTGDPNKTSRERRISRSKLSSSVYVTSSRIRSYLADIEITVAERSHVRRFTGRLFHDNFS